MLRVLVIDDRIPAKNLGYGYPRASLILLCLQELGCVIRFCPQQEQGNYGTDSSLDGIHVLPGNSTSAPQEFRDALAWAEVVWVSRQKNFFETRDFIKVFAPQAVCIFDIEALTFQRLYQYATNGRGVSIKVAKAIEEREQELAAAADICLTVNCVDREHITQRWGIRRVHVIGHAHSVTTSSASRSFRGRNGILFVGSFYKLPCPNEDALEYFLSEILPQLPERSRANHRVFVVGHNATALLDRPIGNLVLSSNIVLISSPKDLSSFYSECRVAVIPTRFAAGLAYKATEAISHALPFVATEVIAKQLSINVPASNNPRLFSELLHELLTDEMHWTKLHVLLKNDGENYSHTKLKAAIFKVLRQASRIVRRRQLIM